MTMQYQKTSEWAHATGVARQICARVFRDGGTPADALDAFGLAHADIQGNWRSAVESIAHALCSRQSQSAADEPLQLAA